MDEKIRDLGSLSGIRSFLQKKNKAVVFTNGCFDLIHSGHIHLFKEASMLGDVLIVAVNDDESVRKIKGPLRPIFSLAERLEILEAVRFIDYLLPFSEATPLQEISVLLPDVLVKGGDWKREEVVGLKEVEKAGGKVVLVPFLKGQSTSRLLSRILRVLVDEEQKKSSS
jgi:rfaE bifunctional protein nucleotidyltransferase chain/domain